MLRCFVSFSRHLPNGLFSWLDLRIDIEFVLNDASINAFDIIRRPCENVFVLHEEGQEGLLFFLLQVSAQLDCLRQVYFMEGGPFWCRLRASLLRTIC